MRASRAWSTTSIVEVSGCHRARSSSSVGWSTSGAELSIGGGVMEWTRERERERTQRERESVCEHKPVSEFKRDWERKMGSQGQGAERGRGRKREEGRGRDRQTDR